MTHHKINKERIKRGLLPLNYLLTREAGNKLPKLKNFFKKFKLKNGVVLAEPGVIKGTCKLAGFKTSILPSLKNRKKYFKLLFETISKKIKNYDVIYAHIKGADEASHDKDFKRKKEILELFDKYFGKLIRKLGTEKFLYIITGDHITDTKTGEHKFGFVPSLIISKEMKEKFLKNISPKEFSEVEAAKIGLTLKNGDIWKIIEKI